jgi:putative sigma-54 modulation protein
MNLTVTGQNFEITDAIKKFLNKRIAKTGNRLFDNANIHFSLYVDKNRHMAEVTVKPKRLNNPSKR